MQMSLGYVAAANPGLDWQIWNWGEDWTWDSALKKDVNAVFESIDCILPSRKMAEEGYLDHRGRAARTHTTDPHYAFARKIVETDKVVLTNKLATSRWERSVIARGGLAEEVNALKRQPGRDIFSFGGVGFASSLLRFFASSLAAAGLVNEFQFFVNPSEVGDGHSIFNDPREGLKLALIGSVAHDCGIVVNRYAPLRSHLG